MKLTLVSLVSPETDPAWLNLVLRVLHFPVQLFNDTSCEETKERVRVGDNQSDRAVVGPSDQRSW